MRGILLTAFLATATLLHADLVWPTESKAFAENKPISEYIQPTASGRIESGLWGDTRRNGYRFHEGIDIKPVRRDRRGEPLDDVRVAMAGKVVMVNRVAGNSSYGRYVVMEHPKLDVNVYTLYAHLAEVDSSIKVGSMLPEKARLGKLGRSSSSIPIGRAQAHLHFEIGLKLGNKFDKWYVASKRFKERNYFGNYNGMNLIGFDPLAFYNAAKDGKIDDGMAGYIDAMPTAVVVRIYTKKVPDFVSNYPLLVDSNGEKCGWDIHFTWFGLPKKMERVKNARVGARSGEVEIVSYNPNELKRKCRKLLQFKGEVPVLTNELKDLLSKIFM